MAVHVDAVKAPRWVWGALVIVVASSLGSTYVYARELHQVNSCLKSYAAETARVAKVTRVAAQERDAVESNLLDGITGLAIKPPKGGPGPRFTRLSEQYRAASANLAAERARNPVPEPPGRCQPEH